MAEIVHEHEHVTHEGGDGTGVIVGIILLVVVLLFLWYAFASGTFRGFLPSGGTNIQVPDKINVNLNQGGGK